MSKREQENREHEKHEHEKREHEKYEHAKHAREHEKDESEYRIRPHGTGYGTERAAYLEFLARRWAGSVPPTAQAYARALKQWRQLPGSVVTAPADLGVVPEAPPVDDSNQPPQTPAKNKRDEERSS